MVVSKTTSVVISCEDFRYEVDGDECSIQIRYVDELLPHLSTDIHLGKCEALAVAEALIDLVEGME